MQRSSHPKITLTRRDFLGVAGLGALAASVSCGTCLSSYLLLRRDTGSPSNAPRMTNDLAALPNRPTTIKHIDCPPIVTRAEWGARPPNHQAFNEPGFYSLDNPEGWREYTGDIRTIYRTVVVHHSAEYETDDLTTVRYIQNMHMDTRRWADLAYHFLVGKTGTIYEGRALNVRGTHTANFNTGSVGVVFLGYLHREAPTPEQLHEGRRLINWLAVRLELTHLAGHYQFNDDTVCPGTFMIPHLAGFAAAAGLILGIEGYEPPPEQLYTPTPDA